MFFLCVACTNHPSNAELSPDNPEDALKMYFNEALINKNFKMMVDLYGGDYNMLYIYNPDIEPNDRTSLMERYCTTNGGNIVRLNEILDTKKIDENEYKFTVSFLWAESGDPYRKNMHFEYTVKK